MVKYTKKHLIKSKDKNHKMSIYINHINKENNKIKKPHKKYTNLNDL